MPAFAHGRQPAPALAWFGSEAGQGVLAVEVAAMARVIETAPPLPWAWFGLPAAAPPEPGRRGLLLRRQGTSFEGTLRCQLPLPLASESLGAGPLQHLLEHATQRVFVHRHEWQAGDLVMWDIRSTLHRCRRYYITERREAEVDALLPDQLQRADGRPQRGIARCIDGKVDRVAGAER